MVNVFLWGCLSCLGCGNRMSKANEPLYLVILNDLKERILQNEYKADQRLPTEVELAKQFSVSRITSKRALAELEREGYIYRIRGSGSYVKALSRYADHSGPRLDGMNKVVSMILPFDNASGLIGYIRGASDYLNAKGYYLSIHQTDANSENENEFLKTLPKNGIPGIIYYPVSDSTNWEIINTLYFNSYPIVTIDKYFESVPVTSVTSDNFNGGYQAASQLIAQGHRRIGFVSSISIESTSSVRNRYFGYCQALKENGLYINDEMVVLNAIVHTRKLGKQEFLSRLMQKCRELQVTAIQCENDTIATDLYKYLSEAGMSIPGDMSLIGFDNNEIVHHLDIPLTTFEQNFFEIGRKSAELVVEGIETGRIASQNIQIPVKLVERLSVGPARDFTHG
ncbi:GntR family transcriptional regulator [Paenibacillus profundus]|nr:GntR family transcriptional regulator [Paenibacillus profundus]